MHRVNEDEKEIIIIIIITENNNTQVNKQKGVNILSQLCQQHSSSQYTGLGSNGLHVTGLRNQSTKKQ